MAKLRLAIIGCGIIARVHAEAIAKSDRLELVAVVDPVVKNRDHLAKQTGAKAFASIETICANEKMRTQIDAVVICTPPSIRMQLVEQALKVGWPVLVEKPLAHHVEAAQALVQIAQLYPDTPAAVAYCHRFTPAIVEMKRQLDCGHLGRLIRFENVFACWHPTMQTSWMSDPKLAGGGSLLDTGSHGVDLFHFLVGPSRTDAAVFTHQWPERGDTNATLLIHHGEAVPGGTPVAGFLASGWAEAARFIVTLVGTKGSLHYDFEKPEQLLLTPSTGEATTLVVETHETRFRHQLEAFADLIENPNTDNRLARFEDGLAVSMTIHDAMEQIVGI